MAQQRPARTFEQFLLVTVAHGRNGVIPYTYPPATPGAPVDPRLPKHKVGWDGLAWVCMHMHFLAKA
jgi:hypothetical protein